MPRVQQNKGFLNNAKNPRNFVAFKMSLQEILNPNPIVPPPVLTLTPTPSITPTSVTPTPTPSQTKTPTPTPSQTKTPTVTPTNTITPTLSSTESLTPTVTPTNTITPTLSSTESLTPTVTPTETTTPTVTPTETTTPTVTPTETTTPTVTPTITPTNLALCFDYTISSSGFTDTKTTNGNYNDYPYYNLSNGVVWNGGSGLTYFWYWTDVLGDTGTTYGSLYNGFKSTPDSSSHAWNSGATSQMNSSLIGVCP